MPEEWQKALPDVDALRGLLESGEGENEQKKDEIGKYSDTFFTEKESIIILESFLSSKKMIATYFDESNIPNHDKFFELLEEDERGYKSPKKMFMVQIKGTETISQNPIKSGKNKGKYCYEKLSTKFLFHVKQRVSVNPAIYFVVDVKNKIIFWIYLSDEKLMEMNFEGKSEIPYYFSEEDKLADIDVFTKKLYEIADDHSQKSPYKSSQEIEYLHDALFYLNNHLDNDFNFIKCSLFPTVWRFGIRHSDTDTISMWRDGEPRPTFLTNKFELYPQNKTKLDVGIQEHTGFFGDADGIFKKLDLTNSTTPQKYVEYALAEIIKKYFDCPYIISHSTEKVVCEILSHFVRDFEYRTNIIIGSDNNLKNIRDIEIALYSVMAYIKKQFQQDEELCKLLRGGLYTRIYMRWV